MNNVMEKHKKEGGIRLKEGVKRKSKKNPLVSVVTVVCNDPLGLKKTIQSVLAQTYENIEHLIIDGGSTDNTLNVIKENEEKIDYYVSERDNGIYDAMNKGILLVKGKWVNFMNAGDTFYSKDVLEKLQPHLVSENIDILYGNVFKGSKKGLSLPDSFKKIWRRTPICHQAAIIFSTIQKQNLYNTKYSISSDYDFFYAMFCQKKKFLYVEETIAMYDNIDGVSFTNFMECVRQDRRVSLKYTKNKLKVEVYFLIRYSLYFLKKCKNLLLKK